MIRIAICDPRAKACTAMRQAVERILANMGALSSSVSRFASLSEVSNTLEARRDGFCTLLLCSIDYFEEQDIRLLVTFKDRFPHTRLVLMSGAPSSAVLAYRAHADGFILTSEGAGEFVQVITKQISQVIGQRGATVTLKSRDSIDVLDANEILFAETSNAGPIIHLVDGKDVKMRGTLQALFDQMAHDERFSKVGGSFIVNLDNIRSAGKSSVVFPDGSVIVIPIRTRKPLQEALAAYLSGASPA